jgi:hypothetical protein
MGSNAFDGAGMSGRGGAAMGNREALALGIVVGAAGAWLWASGVERYVAARTQGIRTRAAEGLRAVEEGAGRVLDRGATSLHRVEGLLRTTREQVSTALRLGQDAIRPAAENPVVPGG